MTILTLQLLWRLIEGTASGFNNFLCGRFNNSLRTSFTKSSSWKCREQILALSKSSKDWWSPQAWSHSRRQLRSLTHQLKLPLTNEVILIPFFGEAHHSLETEIKQPHLLVPHNQVQRISTFLAYFLFNMHQIEKITASIVIASLNWALFQLIIDESNFDRNRSNRWLN